MPVIGQWRINHLDDAPRARRHHHNLGGEVDRLSYRVGYEHHGAALALPELLQLLVQTVTGDLVERPKGLVHHQNLWFKRQCARDRYPLLHAARELPGVLALKPCQTDLLQVLHGDGLGLSAPLALNLQGQGDIGQHSTPRKQRRGLKYIAISPGQAGVMGRHSIDQHLSGTDGLQIRNHPHQCGLATARGADERDKLALGNGEINVAQCMYRRVCRLVDHAGVTHLHSQALRFYGGGNRFRVIHGRTALMTWPHQNGLPGHTINH